MGFPHPLDRQPADLLDLLVQGVKDLLGLLLQLAALLAKQALALGGQFAQARFLFRA
jgi:hypothetical protein